jgi:hypothetical protein
MVNSSNVWTIAWGVVLGLILFALIMFIVFFLLGILFGPRLAASVQQNVFPQLGGSNGVSYGAGR